MPISKIVGFIKSFLPLGLLFVGSLMGCQLPKPESRTGLEANASFYVESLEGDLLKSHLVKSFSVPERNEFRVKACLKDFKQIKAIVNSRFEISNGFIATTDAQGCLYWTEEVKFNVFAEPTYLEFIRTLRPLGLHQGQVQVRFALNPWVFDKSVPLFVDLSRQNISPLVRGESETQLALTRASAEFGTTSTLWVDDGRFFASENSFRSGLNLTYEIKMTPQFITKGVAGGKIFRPVSYGKFEVKLTVFNSLGGGAEAKKRVLAESEVISTEMSQNILTIKAPLHFASVPSRGQNFIVVDLKPLEAPSELRPIKAVFFIGEYDQLKTTAFLKVNTELTQEINSSQNSPLSSLLNSPQVSKGNQESFLKAKVEVAPLEFRFVRVENESNINRTMVFNIRACLKNVVDQKPLRGETFKIQRLQTSGDDSGKSISQRTDNNACLSWDESISFNYYQCQHFIDGHVQISNSELGMNEKLDILVNPWEFWGLMARDKRYVDGSNPNPVNCESKNQNAQLVLEGLSVNTVSIRYAIDHQLNLTLFKKLKMSLSPTVLMHSSLASGRRNNESLRDGIYLLRLALVKNIHYFSNYNLLTHIDKLVTVVDGRIVTDVEFQISDLKSIGDRNTLIVELFPIKESQVVSKKDGELSPIAGKRLMDIVNLNSGLMTQPTVGFLNLSVDDGFRISGPLNWYKLNEYLINSKYKETPNSSLISQILEKEKQDPKLRLKAVEPKALGQQSGLTYVSLKDSRTYSELTQSLGIDLKRFLRFRPLISNQVPHYYEDRKKHSDAISVSVLNQQIQDGKISSELAKQLCVFWIYDFLPSNKKGGIPVIKTDGQADLMLDCVRGVQKNVSDFFVVESKYFVKNLISFRQAAGFNYALSVGTSFVLSNSSAKTQGSSVTGTADVGFKLPLEGLFGQFLSSSGRLSYQVSRGEQDSQSASNGISVNRGASLTVDEISFRLKFGAHEKCLSVRLNPLLFQKNKKSILRTSTDYWDALDSRFTVSEKLASINQGLLLCSGQVTQQPLSKMEKYYVVNQDGRNAYGQDYAHPLNRNLFVMLRGKKEFDRFTHLLKAQSNMPNSSSSSEASEGELSDRLKGLFLFSPSSQGLYTE